jgi:hypothetical protein
MLMFDFLKAPERMCKKSLQVANAVECSRNTEGKPTILYGAQTRDELTPETLVQFLSGYVSTAV